ncbi:MAG: inorganic phosphate transporter [Thaumarchaeota archaeon]|nr:inorganic phosphate transporter [Nitrososphaerota archaeon]
MNYNAALLLTLAGMILGLLILGGSMSGAVLGKLVSPNISEIALISGILVSIISLFILTLLRLPVSLSNCVVGAFVGASLGSSTPINVAFLTLVLGSWIAAPFACAAISVMVYASIVRVERFSSLVSLVAANRALLLSSVFVLSIVLGANNVGLILSFARNESLSEFSFGSLEAAVLIAASLGTIIFGKLLSGVIGERIVGLSQSKTLSAVLGSAVVTAIFTAFSIPISLTQVIVGGMLGAGISQRPSLVNRRELILLISSWALVTVLSAGFGFVATLLISSAKIQI